MNLSSILPKTSEAFQCLIQSSLLLPRLLTRFLLLKRRLPHGNPMTQLIKTNPWSREVLPSVDKPLEEGDD
jgi:hypothetical protein